MLIKMRHLSMVLLSIVLFSSCGEDAIQPEKLEPVAPTLHTDVIRFDRLIHELPDDDIIAGYNSISKAHPAFAQLYAGQLLQASDAAKLERELIEINADTSFAQLYDEVQDRLGDLSDAKPYIDQALQNYLEVFDVPQEQLPDVYTFISGFTYQAFVFDDKGKDGIGLGLEMYLGDGFPYSVVQPSNPLFSSYLIRTYNVEHLPRKVIEVLIEDRLLPPSKSDFMSLMIWGGKKLYIMDQILNFVPDRIVTEYTQEQLDWCRSNETQMWTHFFDNNLFYETNLSKFNKLISPAPTSPGMPSESPGQTGNYMGWQIVKAFMNRNPDVSINELCRLTDAQKILDQSKYKPAR